MHEAKKYPVPVHIIHCRAKKHNETDFIQLSFLPCTENGAAALGHNTVSPCISSGYIDTTEGEF